MRGRAEPSYERPMATARSDLAGEGHVAEPPRHECTSSHAEADPGRLGNRTHRRPRGRSIHRASRQDPPSALPRQPQHREGDGPCRLTPELARRPVNQLDRILPGKNPISPITRLATI